MDTLLYQALVFYANTIRRVVNSLQRVKETSGVSNGRKNKSQRNNI